MYEYLILHIYKILINFIDNNYHLIHNIFHMNIYKFKSRWDVVKAFLNYYKPYKGLFFIDFGSAIVLGFFAIASVLKFVVTYWGHKLGTNIERDMRNDLYSHIQKLNFKYFDNQKSGKLIGRLTNDLMDIGEAAHHGPEDIFLSIMTLI